MRRRQFLRLLGLAPVWAASPADAKNSSPSSNEVRAAYLNIDRLYDGAKRAYIEGLIARTDLNAIVIDFKVGEPRVNDKTRDVIRRFKNSGTYAIGRQVVFQDSYFARKRPDLALRIASGGDFWYSGRRDWKRYWVDMASPVVWDYNIKVAKDGLDMGFDEINFDYIRFPSDGPIERTANGWKEIPARYPVWDGKTPKPDILDVFFGRLRRELKAHKAGAVLSIDMYGAAFRNGLEPGVGQKLTSIARHFDVVAPMAYPSHYQCGEFKVRDPNLYPALVYSETLKGGMQILSAAGSSAVVRPWIQDFSIPNIYGCGGSVQYGPKEVRAEIDASRALGINGFMLWNGSSNFTEGAFRPKK